MTQTAVGENNVSQLAQEFPLVQLGIQKLIQFTASTDKPFSKA